MNTIQTKPKVKTRTFILPLWWMALVAILLLAFGIPPMIARLSAIPADAVHQLVLEGEKVSQEELDALRETRMGIVSWFRLGEYYNDLAIAALEQAGRSNQDEAKKFYQEAEVWQRKALAVSVVDPYGWYRLAYLTYVSQGLSPAVVQAWKQSLASAPYEPRLSLPRLQMAMSLGSFLGNDNQTAINRMVRDVWQQDPDHLIRIAKDGNYISVVETAFENEPEALAAFKEKLKSEKAE